MNTKNFIKTTLTVVALLLSQSIFATDNEHKVPKTNIAETDSIVFLPFGDCDQWVSRCIKESAIIGGASKTIYVLAPSDTLTGNYAYDFSQTIWGISNAYANIMGIAKAACTASPELTEGRGSVARLNTELVTVKVLGLFDIKVIIAGTLYAGSVLEPVRSAKDPYGSVNFGTPFTDKPKALLFDYKAEVSPSREVINAMGLRMKTFDGHDQPQIYLFLQKRWEDKKGNIYAKRVGSVYNRIKETVPDWENNTRYDIVYGDMTAHPDYIQEHHGLMPNTVDYRAFNSKGTLKVINEVGWASEDEEPTHMMLMFSSGCYPAFYGKPGNSLWVDNIRLIY